MRIAITRLAKLGKNCWRAERFTGGFCPIIFICKYPEKKSCIAETEITTEIVVKKKRIVAKDCPSIQALKKMIKNSFRYPKVK
jgi:hypothetical protein